MADETNHIRNYYKLKNYCNQLKLAEPVYTCFQDNNHMWVSTVEVEGIEYKGNPHETKDDAMDSAAGIIYTQCKKLLKNKAKQASSERKTFELASFIIDQAIGRTHELVFPNDIMNPEFLRHMHLVVRNKPVEISPIRSYASNDVRIIIYLSDQDRIISRMIGPNISIDIPRAGSYEYLQCSVLLTLCMELGASCCSIIGPSTNINRIVV